MARVSAWLWQGLNRIEDRTLFLCDRLPSNLSQDFSDNVRIDEEVRSVRWRSDTNRYFKLVFETESGRQIRFIGSVPGVFMLLKRHGDGVVDERPVRRGSLVTLAHDARDVLEVYSPKGGILSFGSWQREISPGAGVRRLPLAALTEYLEPGADRLFYQAAEGPAESLLRFVAEHRVLRSEHETRGGLLHIRLELPAQAEAMRIDARDLLHGEQRELDLACNDVAGRLDAAAKGWLSCGERNPDGRFAHHIELPLDRWSSGAWVFRIETRIGRRWGSLTTDRGDVYAWGLLLDESGAPASTQWLQGQVAALDTDRLIRTFKLTQRSLLPCYAADAWPSLRWLDALWGIAIQRFTVTEGQALVELLALDAEAAQADPDSSWFPLRQPGVALPWIYARPADSYRSVGLRAGLLGELARLQPPLCELFIRGELEPTAAFAFDNVLKMQRGVPPRGFKIERYAAALSARNLDDQWSALRREDWRPSEGDYLGPAHWHFGVNAMRQRYHATLPGNQARRGWALQILRDLNRRGLDIADLTDGLPAHLGSASGLGLPGAAELVANDDTHLQERLNLEQIDRFLSLFAAVCRWEARQPGALASLQTALEGVGLPDKDAMQQAFGYLLHVGRDLFEFYLMLWELAFAADADTQR
jgi:hypothetical protein